MNQLFNNRAEDGYAAAERKAAVYFAELRQQLESQQYAQGLKTDFGQWQKRHISLSSRLSRWLPVKQKPDMWDYHVYMQWLNMTGKMDGYLQRSVAYIYMRDLGRALHTPHTQTRVQEVATSLKKRLLTSTQTRTDHVPEFMSLDGVYRWAQREGVETAMIWVMDKLQQVTAHIPEGMNAEQAQRKLIKIIVGVVLHAVEEMDDAVPQGERSRRLDEAIRLGYSYGLTYPFIDDILDSDLLTAGEKEQYSRLIRRALVTGSVPRLGDWSGSQPDLIRYIHSELREAFEYIKGRQQPHVQSVFFEQAYVFFQAQDVDRTRNLANAEYSNEELYVPVILKSACSRLVARSIIGADEDEGFDQRTFCYGIYNQLADDFADMFDDLERGAVTPYTYYVTYGQKRDDLMNPFELYWAVIHYLIHDVYRSDEATREVILDRAINGLKRAHVRLGAARYGELMDLLTAGMPQLNIIIQRMVRDAEDVDFLDKLLRDQMLIHLRQDREQQVQFESTVRQVRKQINDELPIATREGILPMNELLISAANYSLEGSGKRLRPILAWVMGVQHYGLDAQAVLPLLRSLEYMHTASLIFDDLPSQDNAPSRRGRATLHEVHDSATAELSGLFLIQKSIREQASMTGFPAHTVLQLMDYSAQKAEELCTGQAMDLHSRGQALTLKQLNDICFHKTGAAFEASLVMPAILAQANQQEIQTLQQFAYHAGIAFQIKDDLLDLQGDTVQLGKPVGQDESNNNSTFVSILGEDGARREMWNHYCDALETLREMPKAVPFLKHLLDYIVHRDR
ncbi:polyprenyl synthetase family protein [Paenibacillus sp. WLX2291]|uniref:polyprenyl synthetase family protein n=1 Tax=Paenibacillus sp. WLX2291 TaxID=3296934 RepID=UPI003983F5E0